MTVNMNMNSSTVFKRRRLGADGGGDGSNSSSSSSSSFYGHDHLRHLEEIADNTRGRIGYQLYVSGVDSEITTVYQQPIKLDPKRQYELALLNLETYHSFPNITDKNNQIKIRNGDKTEWTTITIPVGSYEVRAIGNIIAAQSSDKVLITPNLNTLKCILLIKDTYEVSFAVENSIKDVLGFSDKDDKGKEKVYKKGSHASERSVNILQINSILVHVDIITSTYQNGKMEPIIYSFFPNVSPGEKIVAVQKNLIYAPVTTDTIYRMTTWLTDQNSVKLDLRGETLTVRFHLRER